MTPVQDAVELEVLIAELEPTFPAGIHFRDFGNGSQIAPVPSPSGMYLDSYFVALLDEQTGRESKIEITRLRSEQHRAVLLSRTAFAEAIQKSLGDLETAR